MAQFLRNTETPIFWIIASHRLLHEAWTSGEKQKTRQLNIVGLMNARLALNQALVPRGAVSSKRSVIARANKGHYLSTSHTFPSPTRARVHAWPVRRWSSRGRAINGVRRDFSIPFGLSVWKVEAAWEGIARTSPWPVVTSPGATKLPVRYLGSALDAKSPIKWFHRRPPSPTRPFPPHPPSVRSVFLSERGKSRSSTRCHQSNSIDSPVICFPENIASPSGAGATQTFIRRPCSPLFDLRWPLRTPAYSVHSNVRIYTARCSSSFSVLLPSHRCRRRRRPLRSVLPPRLPSLLALFVATAVVVVDGSDCVRLFVAPRMAGCTSEWTGRGRPTFIIIAWSPPPPCRSPLIPSCLIRCPAKIYCRLPETRHAASRTHCHRRMWNCIQMRDRRFSGLERDLGIRTRFTGLVVEISIPFVYSIYRWICL